MTQTPLSCALWLHQPSPVIIRAQFKEHTPACLSPTSSDAWLPYNVKFKQVCFFNLAFSLATIWEEMESLEAGKHALEELFADVSRVQMKYVAVKVPLISLAYYAHEGAASNRRF